MDYGVRGVVSPLGFYTNEKAGQDGMPPAPVVFTERGTQDAEMEDLRQQGWHLPDEYSGDINNQWLQQ